jgi:hypothetical protein
MPALTPLNFGEKLGKKDLQGSVSPPCHHVAWGSISNHPCLRFTLDFGASRQRLSEGVEVYRDKARLTSPTQPTSPPGAVSTGSKPYPHLWTRGELSCQPSVKGQAAATASMRAGCSGWAS